MSAVAMPVCSFGPCKKLWKDLTDRLSSHEKLAVNSVPSKYGCPTAFERAGPTFGG
jgi:hypothetical protein